MWSYQYGRTNRLEKGSRPCKRLFLSPLDIRINTSFRLVEKSSNYMKNMRIGGVPEHFNWPWQQAIMEALFGDLGVEVKWRDYPGGSGAMSQALEAQELDLALLLTEGAVTAIANGARHRIVSWYTRSPLVWGIHVPAVSSFASVEDIESARYAISRYGSGSHLMCYAHAQTRGWDTNALAFELVGNLDGAVAAFANGAADVFFWEKYMTKPLVEAGVFRRVGEFIAPWPAFVLCAARSALADLALIMAMLETVLSCASRVAGSAQSPAAIAASYSLSKSDVRTWLGTTQWAAKPGIDHAPLTRALEVLESVGLVPAGRSVADLVAHEV